VTRGQLKGEGPGARSSPGALAVLAARAALFVTVLIAGSAAGGTPAGGPVALPGEPGQEPVTPIPPPPAEDPLKVRLGEQLFRDPRLSRGHTRSCVSCHDLDSNGASRAALDSAIDGRPLSFNTPSIFNAALSFRFGWEGRYSTLEQQVAVSITGGGMGSPLDEVLAQLSADPQTGQQFQAAYGHGPDSASLIDAIASFVRSLTTPGSRFDLWLQGDSQALVARELEGYQLFKQLGCSACHQGVNFGGNLFERHGIFHPLARRDPVILRVPSLRNVAATPPYFHDGSAGSLPQAVRQMACAQLDENLTDAQVGQIVAFLATLNGQYRGRPIEVAPAALRDSVNPSQTASPCASAPAVAGVDHTD
jgi:cytochrome c peroxidase